MVARELLECYRSIVQCDGYAAYEQFEQMKGITLVGCWAHGRRKYVDALEENRTLVTQAIHYIGRLYKVVTPSVMLMIRSNSIGKSGLLSKL